LFFLEDAKCLKGIIIKSYGKLHLLINPFADPQLKMDIIKILGFFQKIK
jgi:hypothetical protein